MLPNNQGLRKKPKIVFVTGIYPRIKGGAEYQMRIIADQLSNDFEIVYVYLGDVPGVAVKETVCEIIDGYKVYSIQSCSKLDTLFLKYFYSRRILNVLKKEKPHFVYQRVLKFMSFYISSFQDELGYKHFIHIADLFTIVFQHKSFRDKLNFKFFTKTIANKPKFIVQTKEQSDILLSYGVKPVLQVYNMHPFETLDIETIVTEKKKRITKHIVWVANIKAIKQLEIFVDIAEKYKHKRELYFDIIGNIQNESYATPILERLIRLPNVKHYIGKDNQFVNEYILNDSTLVVNTSFSEGFSNVFIQSWLRGVPVLSLNSNPDQIFDKFKEFGMYCNNDINLFSTCLEEIIYDEHYVSRSIACYQSSQKLFSCDNVSKIKKLLAI